MELKKAEKRDLRRLKKIYLETFPKTERKPFWLMKQKALQGKMELLSIRDKGELVGLAFTVLYQDLALLDYFAIARAHRGKKVGSEALELLKERYHKRRFLLEIEQMDEAASNNAERIRRKQFYLKNGMHETGIHVSVFQVPMELLTDKKPLTFEEYYSIYLESIGPVFARQIKRFP